MNIPFLDLKAQYHSIKSEIDSAIQKTLENTAFVLGPEIENFEKEFAAFCGVKYAIAVNSGTAALHLALLSLGIKQGDEVITVPNTFIATAEAISHCGAIPVFCDISEETFNIDENLIESKITSRTKAIIPVHLYGNSCNMDKINEIAKKYNLFVIEDACQAHGAEYKNKRVGSLSNIAAFSFYPGKNLGCYGEGGIIVTNNSELADKCKLYRAHGENPKNTHNVIGYNYRLEGLQGAILRVKLKYLNQWNEQRRKNAEIYTKLLKDIVITPKISENNKSIFHVYSIRHKNRDKLREFLQLKGIATGIHYEKPIHFQKAYAFLNYKESDFPVAEKVTKEILSLPMYPELTESQIEYVCNSIKEFENLKF
ncbi:MAG: DegT/DnrJ/EryC1/StrS family aminotransferase [Candidatus Pacearchaeota archaeon]|nr:DegT/DnrJ/EryC1/StrS family aminotransferase [Candidatus Pacearchaeota archaeon]